MPGDTKTHLARLAKRKRRSSGSLNGATLRLWRAIEAAEACLMDSAELGDQAGVLRAVHATTQAASAYARLLEVGELEGRLSELEAAAAEARKKRSTPPSRPHSYAPATA